MTSLQRRLLCSVAIPACLGFGAAAIVTVDAGGGSVARAQSANPCSPCGAAPAGNTECYVPRLREAQANPCAAKNPCAAANPCNPCATKNPCAAANPCSPCNPCGAAAQPPDVTPDELRAVYDCLQDYMHSAYGGQEDGKSFASGAMPRPRLVAYSDSDLDEAGTFLDWKNFATAPYTSQTHGNRFVVNHANPAAEEAYGKYEEIGTMPEGGIVAKPSFTVSAEGEAALGPLFLMEKMGQGWNAESRDWRYTMVMPDGAIAGRTGGPNAQAVEFCVGCHAAVADGQDSLFFIPEEFRVR